MINSYHVWKEDPQSSGLKKKQQHPKPRNWKDLALGNKYQKFKLNYLGHESIREGDEQPSCAKMEISWGSQLQPKPKSCCITGGR